MTDISDPDKPKTETVPKTIKKSFINWLVPALCFTLVFAVFTVAKSWADDRYTLRVQSEASHFKMSNVMDEERLKREALEARAEEMNRKLDLIIYILQHNDKLDPKVLNP